MLTPEERDDWARGELAAFLSSASAEALDPLPGAVRRDLRLLFEVSARGYREVMLTVVMATLLDSSYRASADLYACNPRPLYESGLRPVLEQFSVPCGQSGPLNIAKAAEALDASWAAQRRPKAAAEAVLRLVAFLERDGDHAQLLGEALAFHFIEAAEEIEAMQTTVSGLLRVDQLGSIGRRLIEEAPDGGNTAQRVCGYLLRHKLSASDDEVTGAEDSASTTNTTSGKPGDLCVVDSAGKALVVYEITTKGFTEQRISECSQALRSYAKRTGDEVHFVRVLCTPSDCPPNLERDRLMVADGLFGVVQDAEISYEFFDLFTWISAELLNLSTEGRQAFFSDLQAYVNEANTRKPVKTAFGKIVADYVE